MSDSRNVVQRQRIRILTVDPVTRTVHGILRDSHSISIAVWETPAAFRWPVVDEIWSIERHGNTWVLGHRLVEQSFEDFGVEDAEEGVMRLDASVIKDSVGKTVVSTRQAQESQVPQWVNGEWVPSTLAGGLEVLDEYQPVTSTTKLNFAGPMVAASQDLAFPDEVTVRVQPNFGRPAVTAQSSDLDPALISHTYVVETDPADIHPTGIMLYPDDPRIEVGTIFYLTRLGSGTFIVQLYGFSPNMTLRGKGGTVSTGDGHHYAIDQGGTAMLRLRADNDWVISGDVVYV